MQIIKNNQQFAKGMKQDPESQANTKITNGNQGAQRCRFKSF